MKRGIFVLQLYICIMVWSQQGHAYEIETHDELSEAAANASTLVKDPTIIQNLGIKGTDKFSNSQNNTQEKTIAELIRDGARFEDGFSYLSTRSLNHFFDPLYNRPLTVTGSARGERSPDWALEDPASLSNQEYSWRDARASLYKGLTLPTLEERDKHFGLTFQTLGHVIIEPGVTYDA